jgi:hypothetical protein
MRQFLVEKLSSKNTGITKQQHPRIHPKAERTVHIMRCIHAIPSNVANFLPCISKSQSNKGESIIRWVIDLLETFWHGSVVSPKSAENERHNNHPSWYKKRELICWRYDTVSLLVGRWYGVQQLLIVLFKFQRLFGMVRRWAWNVHKMDE